MSPVRQNSGLPGSDVQRSALDDGRVAFRDIVGIELRSLRSSELVFTRNAFVAVQLALYTILENAGCFGQQADDLKASAGRNPLVPIG